MDIKCTRTSTFTHIKYLLPIFHAGFNRFEGVFQCVHESIKYELAGTKANFWHIFIEATNKDNQVFVLVCIYIYPSFKQSLISKELELAINDHYKAMGTPVFSVDIMNFDLLEQKNFRGFIQ